MNKTKRQLPAEWSPQDGVILTWPHPYGDWAPWLVPVEKIYCRLAEVITRFEALLVVCYDKKHQAHIQQQLKHTTAQQDKLLFRVVKSNDSWARDHGPITILQDGVPRLLDFTFNGWGGKYASQLDDAITQQLYSQQTFANIDVEAFGLVLEGGSIDSDGAGTLLTTSHCLLTPTRNPSLDQNSFETVLKATFGLERIHWLTEGELEGDDTDSHIDMLARFCNPTTIAYCSCDDSADEHYTSLSKMKAELEVLRDSNNKPYTLVPLPMPNAVFNKKGQRLPGSYANFLIINGAVLVPLYGDEHDQIALQRLQDCFPEREVIGIDCRALIEQFGSLHCITMQLPEGTLKSLT